MKTRCPPRFEETFVQFPGQDTTRRWEGQYSGRYYGCPSPPLGRAIFESLLRLSRSPVGKGNIQGATTPVRSPRWEGQCSRRDDACPFPPLGRAMFKARRRLSVPPLGRAMFKARRRLSVPPLGRAIFKARRRLSVPPVGKGNSGRYYGCPFALREIEGERAAQAPDQAKISPL